MDINLNPFDTGNPMSIKDAAIISTVVSLVIWILGFFANSEWIAIQANVELWCFNAIKSYITSWAGTFVTLAGLEELIKRSQHK